MSVDELLERARSRLRRLTAAEASRAAADGALIVDIRSAGQQRRDGLVAGAVRIERNVLEWRADPRGPWHDARLAGRRGPIILMCAEGYQSSLAAAGLHDMGITDATDLIDGFDGWRQAGLPVQQWREDSETGGAEMAYTVVDSADVEASFGAFRKMRQALGVTGFGVNQLDLPAGATGREHDETDGGQEEVYVVLAGGGTMLVDGEPVELVAGRWLRIDPGATRVPTAGPDGLSLIMIGSTPGSAYEPRHGL